MRKQKSRIQNKALSPVAYMRKRARNLEVLECYVNDGWEESRMANVWVARKHTNGNITMAFYLVDLMCLGVKDTFFRFNLTPVEYDEMVERYTARIPFDKISYELAHNIVYAGYEYALDYGIEAHNEFTKATMYMLEEDSDEIEIIEIECGQNGKPHLMVDNSQIVKANKVIEILQKTAGEGNFNYTIGEDSFPAED